MPALVSHHRFATMVLSHADPKISSVIESAPLAFRWGAQGPDILFYHNPFRPTNSVTTLGKQMHHTRVCDSFRSLSKSCRSLNMPAATAYLLGMCCHYSLDRTVHPFVTYICNYRLDPLYPTLSPSVLHRMCESELDRALIAHMLKGESTRFRAYRLLSMDKQTSAAAGALLAHTAWDVYGIRLSPKTVRSCMNSMLTAYRILHDPNGRRNEAFGKVEKLASSPGLVSSLMRPTRPLSADCVNAGHRAWIDAATPHMRRYDSFFSLMQQAQRPALQLMEACWDAIETGSMLAPELFPTNYSGLR